jgi:hypothetical protein
MGRDVSTVKARQGAGSILATAAIPAQTALSPLIQARKPNAVSATPSTWKFDRVTGDNLKTSADVNRNQAIQEIRCRQANRRQWLLVALR